MDVHADGEGREAALERVREKLYAFCFPNVPASLEEQVAFEQAACLQYEHETAALADTGGRGMPPGVTRFRLGDFQVEADAGAVGGQLTVKNICPAAYGLLLRSGLLYRGAEGRG